jgi:outer membrane protein assembly factor BamB
MPTAPDPRSATRQPVRWWPAALVVIFAGFTIFYFRVIREDSQQWRNLYSIETGFVATFLLLLWILFLSRLRWKVRALLFCGFVGLVVLLAAMFRIHGVTGDLVPILKFRWSRSALPLGSSAGSATQDAPHSALPLESTLPTNTYPEFLGPHRNATLPQGLKLARDWTAQPPQKLWRQPIGAAWSGFAVVGNRAVTLEQRGDEEWAVCYELLSGAVFWTHSDKARYFTTIAGEGPRTTPSIAGDKVLTLGATGILNCLDLATGKLIWSTDIIAKNQTHVPEWGVAGSPLVLGDLVIVNPGGKPDRSLVAYRLSDGEFDWSGGDDNASYSSPCAASIGGISQVLIFNQHAIFGHDAGTGIVLWQHPWDSKQPHVALPVVLAGDRVLASSGYGVGSELLHIARDGTGKFTVNRLWKTNRLKAKFNNVVTLDGYVYGLDDGILACLDLATGELKWKEGRYGHGQFILVRDLLLITAENGEVVMVEPVPSELRELAKFRALAGKTWNPPALVGELLLVRNDQEAACYRLPVQMTSAAYPR